MRFELFAPRTSFKDAVAAARFAEEAGFDAFAYPEIAHDPFLHLAACTHATTHVGLRTAIAVAFARSPMVTANLAWDLHEESNGRFVLGLGTQVQAHVEKRFSATWTKPRSQLREYVQAIRAIHRAWEKKEKLRFVGEHYRFTLMTPEFAPAPTGRAPVPIYTAAVRPGMIELAGEVADGVRLHGFMTRRYVEEVVVPALEKGLASRGRARSNFEVCGGGFVATGPDTETVDRLREVIRYRVAFYASTPAYAPVLALHGWQDLGERLRTMTLAGRWQEMAKEVPDDVLDAFCVSATWGELRPALEARFGGLSDAIELSVQEDQGARAVRELLDSLRGIETPCAEVVTSWDDVPATDPDPARAKATPHF